jgi:hypothetical protein
MLDVIGAGTTATCTVDWHVVWKSRQCREMRANLDRIHEEDSKCSPVSQANQGSTVHLGKFYNLWIHANRQYWRDPPYIIYKLALNVVDVS